jgi:hypothetical protein
MNELSWLIYAADVAGNVDSFGILTVLGGIGGGIAASILSRVNDDWGDHRAKAEAWDQYMADHVKYPFMYPKPESDRPARPERELEPFFRPAKPWFFAAMVAAVVVAVTPGQGTLYAIAASEVGESVLNSETGGKAIEALNSWLDRQIAGNR